MLYSLKNNAFPGVIYLEQMLLLGPLQIKFNWIVVAIGLIFGYVLLTYSSPFKGEKYKKEREIVVNSMMYFIIVYILERLFLNCLPFFQIHYL